MPYIRIDHSDNLNMGDNINDVLATCHDILVEILPTKMEACRSLVEKHGCYHVGDADNQSQKAFVTIVIKIMAGRSEETLTKAGTQIIELISAHVKKLNPKLHTEFSIEMVNLSPVYIKLT
jgi:5-carboxymethyl-2-hydroxymuconate isomerase